MRLADFILRNTEAVLREWEAFARGITPGADMEPLALRDHAAEILLATARDMGSTQNATQRQAKSQGHESAAGAVAGHGNSDGDTAGVMGLNGASELHAIDRLGSGFNLLEVVSEYRALRASVLRLWQESGPRPHACDVDDVTRFNESIDQSVAKAVSSYTQRVDQARDLFLAILSHDLRNPLNSIAMSAELLPRLGAPVPEAVGVFSQIATNAQVMARMIGDLLDYTRTRLGAGMPVAPTPMDAGKLCRELYDEFRTAHPDREMCFRCDGDATGEWDTDRLRQAVSNLLGNAVQHGDGRTPVELTVAGHPEELSIAVRNGGAPIPPGELPNIFKPLVRGSSAAHPKESRPGSIGLGLYIAREVAKSHGGRIDVTSSAEAGTTFTVHLPRHFPVTSWHPILDEEHVRRM